MSSDKPARVIFAGTPDFAVASLQALLAAPINVVGVFTQPDRRAGRGKQMQASPVKALALKRGLAVFQPTSLKSLQARTEIEALRPDLMVVTAYGLMLPRRILQIPRLGCINIHASLLPRWRGAAPIQRAIEAGDAQTGVCIMQMGAGLDTGPVLASASLDISNLDTGGTLHDRLMVLSQKALENHLPAILDGKLIAKPQSETGATYASKLSKQEARLDWHADATSLARKVRAFNPWPVAETSCHDVRLRILKAVPSPQHTQQSAGTVTLIDDVGIHVQTAKGALILQSLQKPGGKVLDSKALLNGFALSCGDRFA